MKKALWIFVLCLGCETQDDQREGVAERRKKMQDRARVEAHQSDAWQVMDESIGLAK